MKLSIIIPIYNEEETVAKCLKRVKEIKIALGIKKEIIVVDDGSTDNSKLKISAFAKASMNKINFKLISHKKNQGKGAAVRSGIEKATGDYVIIQDGDLEYDPQDYKKLIKPILDKKTEVVYGSRFLGEHKSLFFWHMLANKLLSFLTNILYDSTLSDMEVGYKLIPRKLLLSISLKEKGFGFEPEVTAKILKRKIRIYEVPISYAGREYKDGKKITWKDGLKAVFILLKIRFFDE